MINKFFKIHFITLILFTIFLLIEGFLTYYSSKLSFYFDSFDVGVGGGYNAKIWNENGLIEATYSEKYLDGIENQVNLFIPCTIMHFLQMIF